MDKVVHFEIPAEDVERAKEFYSKIFRWNIISIPEMQYNIVHTVEIDEKNMPKTPGAINGGIMKKSKEITNPVIIINVENIDNSLKVIEDNGGEVIKEKMQVGDMGYVAYFKDTEGNILGLWETIKKS
ncbi:VOC family protein [Candidatus Pacearchaeota archaeon]|nr:VOC family protein [Candidatus Pacearchaeota archaeon]